MVTCSELACILLLHIHTYIWLTTTKRFQSFMTCRYSSSPGWLQMIRLNTAVVWKAWNPYHWTDLKRSKRCSVDWEQTYQILHLKWLEEIFFDEDKNGFISRSEVQRGFPSWKQKALLLLHLKRLSIQCSTAVSGCERNTTSKPAVVSRISCALQIL